MTPRHPLSGIYAAALTPFKPDDSINLAAVLPFLDLLAAKGCHGALLFGTTGEGPSLSSTERQAVLREAVSIRKQHPEFRVLAGTGTPSLEQTVELNRMAFDLGCQGVVVLPPYYFQKISDDGLFAWFSRVIQRSVPRDGFLLGYHIPSQSRVPLSLNLLERLKDSFPTQFAGIKDSSADPEFSALLGQRLGGEFLVLNGSDRLLTHAMKNQAGGAITAMANLYSALLRRGWDLITAGKDSGAIQQQLNARRDVLEKYPPFPAMLKPLLARMRGVDCGSVRPPLMSFSEQDVETCRAEFSQLDGLEPEAGNVS